MATPFDDPLTPFDGATIPFDGTGAAPGRLGHAYQFSGQVERKKKRVVVACRPGFMDRPQALLPQEGPPPPTPPQRKRVVAPAPIRVLPGPELAGAGEAVVVTGSRVECRPGVCPWWGRLQAAREARRRAEEELLLLWD